MGVHITRARTASSRPLRLWECYHLGLEGGLPVCRTIDLLFMLPTADNIDAHVDRASGADKIRRPFCYYHCPTPPTPSLTASTPRVHKHAVVFPFSFLFDARSGRTPNTTNSTNSTNHCAITSARFVFRGRRRHHAGNVAALYLAQVAESARYTFQEQAPCHNAKMCDEGVASIGWVAAVCAVVFFRSNIEGSSILFPPVVSISTPRNYIRRQRRWGACARRHSTNDDRGWT